MEWAKNTTFIAECTDYTFDGLGIVRYQGMCFFVRNLLVGEQAEIQIMAVKKNRGYGRVLRLLRTSPQRTAPRCPVAGKCGGCQLQHMSADLQAQFKRQRVADCFRRIGRMEVQPLPVITMQQPWHYRNKVQVPVGVDSQGQIRMGYYRTHSHDIVDWDRCCLHSELENEILLCLRELIRRHGNPEQFRHILIKHAFVTGQVMVVLIVNQQPLTGQAVFVETLRRRFPQIRSILMQLNQRQDNVILGDQQTVLWGDSTIEEELLGLRFQISARAFYQINPLQTAKLYQTALDFAGLTGSETLMDVYCGTGTIGLCASRQAKRVIGIEIVPSAVEDARRNALRNGITNAEFYCGEAGEWTEKLRKQGVQPDVAMVDPPRKGLDEKTLNALEGMNPQRIVYVSCDPATLARDCAWLCAHGYQLERVQPLDMFPATLHVETIVLLQKLNS